MTGPDHYRKAEELAEQARKHLGQGDGQATAAAWAAVAQVHATLALAAATGRTRIALDTEEWAKAAGPKTDISQPQEPITEVVAEYTPARPGTPGTPGTPGRQWRSADPEHGPEGNGH